MKSFKSYIKENVKQECGIKYGKYLFGELLGQGEKDTGEEQELLSLLGNYILDPKHRSKKFIQALKKLRTCKTLFNKELTAKGTFAYRGLYLYGRDHESYSPLFYISDLVPLYKLRPEGSRSEDYDGQEISITGFDYYKIINSQKYIGFDTKYTPINEVESWTTTLENNSFIGSFADVIYQIPLKQNEFIFDADFLDLISTKVFKYTQELEEYEVIRVEKRPSRAICYVKYEHVIKYLNDEWEGSFDEDDFFGPARFEGNKLIIRPLV